MNLGLPVPAFPRGEEKRYPSFPGSLGGLRMALSDTCAQHLLYSFTGASRTERNSPGDVSHGSVSSHSSGGWKAKIKELAARFLRRPLCWATRWPSRVFTWVAVCVSVSQSLRMRTAVPGMGSILTTSFPLNPLFFWFSLFVYI